MPADLAWFALAGFVAQLVDGALGMAYGVTCSSLLLSVGYSPAAASASVHAAELVTCGISGHFHWRYGNVDRPLFRALVLPGAIGGALGAWLLVSWPESLTPFVSLYLLLMGLRLLWRAASNKSPRTQRPERLRLLGFTGGALDAVGGGGWGPIVTGTLLGHGREPRLAIGSVNRAEFFVTLAQSVVFVSTLGLTHLSTTVALCAGGAAAAPLGAVVAKYTRPRVLLALVGLLIVGLSLRSLSRLS